MQIKIVAIGKIKEEYLKKGIEDYAKRLSKFAKVNVVELPEEDIAARPTADVKEREAQKLKKHLGDTKYVIALDREGKELSSEELAERLNALMLEGKSSVTFIVGGALGFAPSILDEADLSISLSKLTFTHQMARFILLEQLYRAFKILRGEPYHY